MSRLLLGTALALTLPLSGAFAATLTTTDSTGLVQTDFSSLGLPGVTNLPQLELDLFDSALGTLTSVELKLSGMFEANGTLTNTGTTSFAGFEQSVSVNLLPSASPATPAVSLSLSDGIAPQIFVGGQVESVDLTGMDMVSQTLANLSDFIGSGTFNLDFVTLSASTISGGGNLEAVISTFAQVDAEITYTFDEAVNTPAVPLPAGGLLLLSGLGLVGAMRRKR